MDDGLAALVIVLKDAEWQNVGGTLRCRNCRAEYAVTVIPPSRTHRPGCRWVRAWDWLVGQVDSDGRLAVEKQLDLWKDDARRYCENADYWRTRCERAEADPRQLRDELRVADALLAERKAWERHKAEANTLKPVVRMRLRLECNGALAALDKAIARLRLEAPTTTGGSREQPEAGSY
jgi:hypothetical protein